MRREWAQEHGLEVFAGQEYDRALAVVTERLGVTTGILTHVPAVTRKHVYPAAAEGIV